MDEIKVGDAATELAKKLFEDRNKKTDWAETWDNFKHKLIQLLGSLVMEKDDGIYTLSTGKVAFWLAFIPALYIWVSGHGILENGIATKDISENHLKVLMVLITYNFGKKMVGAMNNIWGKDSDSPNDGPG